MMAGGKRQLAERNRHQPSVTSLMSSFDSGLSRGSRAANGVRDWISSTTSRSYFRKGDKSDHCPPEPERWCREDHPRCSTDPLRFALTRHVKSYPEGRSP